LGVSFFTSSSIKSSKYSISSTIPVQRFSSSLSRGQYRGLVRPPSLRSRLRVLLLRRGESFISTKLLKGYFFGLSSVIPYCDPPKVYPSAGLANIPGISLPSPNCDISISDFSVSFFYRYSSSFLLMIQPNIVTIVIVITMNTALTIRLNFSTPL
jgi:hypothetical protein